MTFHPSEQFIAEKLRMAYRSGSTASMDGDVRQDEGANIRRAAVLIPLAWWQAELQLVLTRRTDVVEHHKGQVSFPGGGCEVDETSAEETAVREAGEEIGLKPTDIRILGRMNDMLTITHYRITPVVGVIPWPYPVRLEPAEVARVFTIPLLWLANSQNWEERLFVLDGVVTPSPVIVYQNYDDEILWGISARITLDFLGLLDLIDK
jgi:8-oxo-dGTP pyrophosphatase MutT (NUDIX family)